MLNTLTKSDSLIELQDTSLPQNQTKLVEIDGTNLSIENITLVANNEAKVIVSKSVLPKIEKSCIYLDQAVKQKRLIYGVTSNFGGLATAAIDQNLEELQENLIWGLTCGTGKKLANAQVRAGMLIRANSLARGISGIRLELINRLCDFLNAGVTPVIYEHGSIGASGDLVPLAYMAGALIGLSPLYKVNYHGQEISATEALELLNLPPLKLLPKEGLALVNGTSMMAGIAANCVSEMQALFKLTLHVHAFFIQALRGNSEAFADFVHTNKPHTGQIKTAAALRYLLKDSKFITGYKTTNTSSEALIQDRYSVRCLPQYLGVIAEGIDTIKQQIEIESNSATDNPLIDAENEQIYHAGNFMGQYVGVGMDQLRYYLGLMAKHLDTQIALLVTPEFSKGLPPCLIADKKSSIKFGLKGLQICANSIMPLILHAGHSIAPLFPTHAEQFNQNINSQGYSSAILTSNSLELTRQYLAITLIFAVQAIDVCTYHCYGNYNACEYLSPKLIELYKAVYVITKREINEAHPFIYDNREQTLDIYIDCLQKDLKNPHGKIMSSINFNEW